MVSSPAEGTAGAERRALVEARLQQFLSDELRDLPVTRMVRQGDPARQIVSYADGERVDLIVMPTHGYGPFRRFLLGSVVAKVLHDTDCPVWTGVHLEEAPEPESLSVRRIACAVDLGPHAEQVLSWAFGMATAFTARLSVLHVTPLVEIAVAGGSEPEPEVERAEQARGEIEDFLAKVGAEADIAIDSGAVAQTVYDFAAGCAADLLIIGRGAAKDGIVGRLRSHAYAIIRESPCPVVSV